MWILKNSKDLLDNLKSRSFSRVSSIKTFDFSTLYTTLPHDKLKTHLKETIHKAFSHRNYGSKCVVLGYNSTYFSNKIQKGKACYSEEQVISMLEFLTDNIFVSFGGTLFQQVVGIPMGTNCAPLLADLFLYSYESEFLQKLVKDKKIHEARAFNFTYRYIDDVLSINNSRFAEFLPLIYPPELEVKETTDTASFASFLDLYLEFDASGQLSTKIYVYFQGQMSSDFLQDLICTCKGKAVCSSGCVCFEQGLSCTDICPCQAGELCRNSNTQMSRNKSIDDDDVDLLQLDV